MSSEATGKSRRERERDRHRQEILAAAQRVVDARGVEGLTVDEVARQAEFAVGSIYRHFRSKEELLEVLVAHLAEPLCEEIEEIAASSAPFRDQLHRSVEAVLTMFRERLALFQAFHLLGGPLPGEDSAARQHLQAVKARWRAAVERIVQNGVDAGEVRGGSARQDAVLLMLLTAGVARWTVDSAFPLEPTPAQAIVGLFLDGVRER